MSVTEGCPEVDKMGGRRVRRRECVCVLSINWRHLSLSSPSLFTYTRDLSSCVRLDWTCRWTVTDLMSVCVCV